MPAYNVFFYQPSGTDITATPFDGILTECTAAEYKTALGITSGVEIQNAGTPVADGPFTTLNFAPNTTVSNVSMASAGGGVVNLTIGLNLGTSNTWTVDQVVPAEAYGSGWNGSNEIPTKNDIYDQMELKGAKVGLKLYIRDAAGTPHYWQVTVSTLGVLTTADAGTTLPTDGIVIYA